MQEGISLVEIMKLKGDECLKRGLMYDALWKYAHAIQLSKKLHLTSKLAVLFSNCAKACLKLERHMDAFKHASNCIKHDPKFDKVSMSTWWIFILMPTLGYRYMYRHYNN